MHNVQSQSLAYSTDGGESWQMYEGNPVLTNPELADFRDPKVFWDEQHQQWIMSLAVDQVIQFYHSSDLKQWTLSSEFGRDLGAHGGVWECPDLFPLKVEGTGLQKWILLVSINPGGPNGGSATQYFIGEFDGKHFRADHTETLWMDYGPDNYAGVTWSDMPSTDSRRILIGWMSNWEYAKDTPTAPWRGAMTFPRELGLQQTEQGIRLTHQPVGEIEHLFLGPSLHHQERKIINKDNLTEQLCLPEHCQIKLHASWQNMASSSWCMAFSSTVGDQLKLTFSLKDNELIIDRSQVSHKINNAMFSNKIHIPIDLTHGIQLTLLKDTSSLELFANDGKSLATLLYFSEEDLTQLHLGINNPNVDFSLHNLEIQPLCSIWHTKSE